jgi:hypothetical protein
VPFCESLQKKVLVRIRAEKIHVKLKCVLALREGLLSFLQDENIVAMELNL